MTTRIPHSDEVIEDIEHVEAYADSHEKNAGAHFSAFLKDFEKLDVKGRLLEVGPGPGFLTGMIAERSPDSHITALEPSAGMIRIARKYIDRKGLNDRVTFVKGAVDDFEVMKMLDEFDLVYSTFSLRPWSPCLTYRG